MIVSLFLFMFLMMWAVYKIFGNSLSPKEERVGLIMELPPYHKPDFKNILYVTFQRTFDIFRRALRMISIVSIVFFVLTYGFGGKKESSILYRLGVLIEPVTMFFGVTCSHHLNLTILKWGLPARLPFKAKLKQAIPACPAVLFF